MTAPERRIGLTVGLCGLDPQAWVVQRRVEISGVWWAYRRATGWQQEKPR
jgi:hypothetical protein